MKPFSPLKPLIAAMFVLAAASASAQTSESATYVTPLSTAIFSQTFAVAGPSVLDSWTFFGSQTEPTAIFEFGVFALDGLTPIDVGYTGIYSSGSNGGWTFTGGSQTLEAGSYFATLTYTGAYEVSDGEFAPNPYGTVTLSTVAAGAPAYLVTDATPEGSNGQITGRYQYEASFSPVTAVPEPESYAMLLAGLGLMGAIARRRSRKV